MIKKDDTSFQTVEDSEEKNASFDNDSYYIFKLYELILTEHNLKKWIDEYPVLSTSIFLEGFLDYIKMLIKKNYLGDSFKDNIFRYLVLVRFNDNNRVQLLDNQSFEQRVNLVNEIIRIVHSGKGTNYLNLCRSELFKRTRNPKYLLQPNISQTEKQLFDSIKFDQFVIFTHSIEMPDDEFMEKYVIDLTRDLKYFQTINCILDEYPQQFNDALFQRRYNRIIDFLLKINIKDYQVCSSIISFDTKVKSRIEKYNLDIYSKTLK